MLPPRVLNYKLKHLLAYFWWCGDKGCQEWNYRIAKRFKCSQRTIRRWIKKLEDERLIYINFPMKTTRTIYRRPYYQMWVWLDKTGRVKRLPKILQAETENTQGRTEVAYISNAQRIKYNKTVLNTQQIGKVGRKRRSAANLITSNAGGLCGSREFERRQHEQLAALRQNKRHNTPPPHHEPTDQIAQNSTS